jgi:hypothetical protein
MPAHSLALSFSLHHAHQIPQDLRHTSPPKTSKPTAEATEEAAEAAWRSETIIRSFIHAGGMRDPFESLAGERQRTAGAAAAAWHSLQVRSCVSVFGGWGAGGGVRFCGVRVSFQATD